MKMYTRTGDKGTTSTLNGRRVAKDSCLIQANGELDELVTQIDKILAYMNRTATLMIEPIQVGRIRDLLWQLGGELSFGKLNTLVKIPIKKQDVEDLELWMKSFNINVKGFQRFSNHISLEINETRVRTRRLERTLTEYLRHTGIRQEVYQYMNRLSSYFFCLAVYVEQMGEKHE